MARSQAAVALTLLASTRLRCPVAASHLATLTSTHRHDQQVLSEVRGHAAIATLNRPRALNALNTRMVEAMFELYSQWDADPGVACILLKASTPLPACRIHPMPGTCCILRCAGVHAKSNAPRGKALCPPPFAGCWDASAYTWADWARFCSVVLAAAWPRHAVPYWSVSHLQGQTRLLLAPPAAQGAGDKAFCAGGDVKTVVQQGLAGQFDEALRQGCPPRTFPPKSCSLNFPLWKRQGGPGRGASHRPQERAAARRAARSTSTLHEQKAELPPASCHLLYSCRRAHTSTPPPPPPTPTHPSHHHQPTPSNPTHHPSQVLPLRVPPQLPHLAPAHPPRGPHRRHHHGGRGGRVGARHLPGRHREVGGEGCECECACVWVCGVGWGWVGLRAMDATGGRRDAACVERAPNRCMRFRPPPLPLLPAP